MHLPLQSRLKAFGGSIVWEFRMLFSLPDFKPDKIGPGQEVIKLFPCSTQLITKFILLINVQMQTIVGILTCISMINTTSERLNARNFFICRYFSFYEQLKFRAQLSWAWKKFYNLQARIHSLLVWSLSDHHFQKRVKNWKKVMHTAFLLRWIW